MDKVVHFEIPADDVERAKKFYGDTFGWGMMPMPDMGYTILRTAPTDDQNMITEPGAINGGMYQRDEQSAKSPVIVINVDSVDEAVGKVEAAGGKVFRPKVQVGNMGLYAQVIDTENNIIGVWENIKKGDK
jgi:uncharacterized protein